ncbi:MAG: transporter [bacterium]|nr:transporter [bacterium]
MNNREIAKRVLLALPLFVQCAFAEESAVNDASAARESLTQKADDATTEKNLQEVFQASEKTYSLLKSGKVGFLYSVDYSYFRDSRIDIAISDNSSQLTRFRIQEDAQHTVNNVLEFSYGVWDNLTFTSSLPLVSKVDAQSNLKTTGLGDISFGARWQPVPLKRGLPTSTLFASLSTATGDSPYEINTSKDLSTGKGYYSLSAGASISKVADPIVLFASGSYALNTHVSGLNQNRGGRVLQTVEPGDSIGVSMGMAYALNYDVSITASYQQSFSFASTYDFKGGDVVSTLSQTSAVLNFSLGLRTSASRIVNVNFGYGLTPDTPNVTLGFSMPINFLGSSEE